MYREKKRLVWLLLQLPEALYPGSSILGAFVKREYALKFLANDIGDERFNALRWQVDPANVGYMRAEDEHVQYVILSREVLDGP